MRRGFAAILILGLVAALLALGGTFYLKRHSGVATTTIESQQTPLPSVDTTNWKTYTNTKVGFQLKYPSSFGKLKIPGGVSPNPVYADGTESDVEVLFDGSATAYGLTVFPFSGTLGDLLAERKIRYVKPDLKIPVIFPDTPTKLEKTIIIDGFKANWYSDGYENGTSSSSKEVAFIGKNYGFIFRADGNAKTVDIQEMDQILSTFKFTN